MKWEEVEYFEYLNNLYGCLGFLVIRPTSCLVLFILRSALYFSISLNFRTSYSFICVNDSYTNKTVDL